ncbi:hypothetical protein C8R47DRAFT_1197271, partial [Mycena vitilis]
MAWRRNDYIAVLDNYRSRHKALAPIFWFFELVASSLARSLETPLNPRIWGCTPTDGRLVQLSLRPYSLHTLARAKGNLSLLESLTLSSTTNIDNQYADDILATAPRLCTVRLDASLGQFCDITYENGESSRLSLVLLLSLSTHASWPLASNASAIMLPHELTPVTSNLSNLSVSFSDISVALSRTDKILGAILRSLTLPCLASLRFIKHVHTGDHDTDAGASRPQAPYWNHIGFLAFAARSALRNTLTQLEVRAVIRDHELLECLLHLPLLEELRLRDCVETHPTLTANVQRDRLTFCSGESNSVVPHLNILGLASVMPFRDSIFLELVLTTARLYRWCCTTPERSPSSIHFYIQYIMSSQASIVHPTRTRALQSSTSFHDPDALNRLRRFWAYPPAKSRESRLTLSRRSPCDSALSRPSLAPKARLVRVFTMTDSSGRARSGGAGQKNLLRAEESRGRGASWSLLPFILLGGSARIHELPLVSPGAVAGSRGSPFSSSASSTTSGTAQRLQDIFSIISAGSTPVHGPIATYAFDVSAGGAKEESYPVCDVDAASFLHIYTTRTSWKPVMEEDAKGQRRHGYCQFTGRMQQEGMRNLASRNIFLQAALKLLLSCISRLSTKRVERKGLRFPAGCHKITTSPLACAPHLAAALHEWWQRPLDVNGDTRRRGRILPNTIGRNAFATSPLRRLGEILKERTKMVPDAASRRRLRCLDCRIHLNSVIRWGQVSGMLRHTTFVPWRIVCDLNVVPVQLQIKALLVPPERVQPGHRPGTYLEHSTGRITQATTMFCGLQESGLVWATANVPVIFRGGREGSGCL